MAETETDTRTGTVCTHEGAFITDCSCREIVSVAHGDVYPVCSSCGSAVFWMFYVSG